jgi:phage I-like protein
MNVTNHPKPPEQHGQMLPLRSTPLPADAPPNSTLLTPWGWVESSNGNFLVDEESAELVAEAFRHQGTELPIDYEHQTLGGAYAAPNGQAPAAGWIKAIRAVPGVGLHADIEWNEAASDQLRARQYRYLSPVALIRQRDRKLVAIHSAALTNKPAIVAMVPIVNRSSLDSQAVGALASAKSDEASANDNASDGTSANTTTVTTERAPLPEARGHLAVAPAKSPGPAAHDEPDALLPETAQTQDANSTPDACLTALRAQLNLAPEAATPEILAAAQDRIGVLEAAQRTEAIAARLAEAQRAGRLVDAQLDWARRLILSDEALFDEWYCTAPIVLQPGALPPPSECAGTLKRDSATARARAEYRSSPMLQGLTDEDAYAAEALRRTDAR